MLDISPRPEPDLADLYQTTSEYVDAVEEAADELVADGFLLPADAEQITADAHTVEVQ